MAVAREIRLAHVSHGRPTRETLDYLLIRVTNFKKGFFGSAIFSNHLLHVRDAKAMSMSPGGSHHGPWPAVMMVHPASEII